MPQSGSVGPRGDRERWGLSGARWGALRSIGIEPSRAEIDEYWHDRRERREVDMRKSYGEKFAALDLKTQALFRAAGMAPDQAVIRWGNYDMTLVMSGGVIAPVDSGRQYGLRPGVRSIWIRQTGAFDLVACMFQFPNTPEVRRLAALAGAEIISGPSQTTNSWGCRGPEPDLNAPVRGIVLGDSFMQGFLIGDQETPPEQLRQLLRAEIGSDVSILNTGTFGYGPEHYYYTLVETLEGSSPSLWWSGSTPMTSARTTRCSLARAIGARRSTGWN